MSMMVLIGGTALIVVVFSVVLPTSRRWAASL